MSTSDSRQPLPDDTSEELSPGDVAGLDDDRRANRADPQQVRFVLAMLRDHLRAQTLISGPLADFTWRALDDYLRGRHKNLDQAFGLARKRGRRPADEQKQIGLAAEVLRLRLTATTYEAAVSTVVEQFGSSTSVVNRAWRDHREAAAHVVLIEKALAGFSLSDEEQVRWKEIFER
jgi:hypothetical protein